ncbi:MAG: leucine-rich repeat protein [Acutalibacteraceae bacterium]
MGRCNYTSNSLKTLGKYAFGSCTKLEGIYLPEGLQEIGNKNGGSVFKDSSSLKFVRVAGSNSTASIELPNSLISIGQDAFSGAMTSATPLSDCDSRASILYW